MQNCRTARLLAYSALVSSLLGLLLVLLFPCIALSFATSTSVPFLDEDTFLLVFFIALIILTLSAGFLSTLAEYCNRRFHAGVRKASNIARKASMILMGFSAVVLFLIFSIENTFFTDILMFFMGFLMKISPRLQVAAIVLFVMLIEALAFLPGKLFIKYFHTILDNRLDKETEQEALANKTAIEQKQRDDAMRNRLEREEEAERKRRQQAAWDDWDRQHK